MSMQRPEPVDECRSATTDVGCMHLPSTTGSPSSSDGCINYLMCGFDDAPDSFSGVVRESSGDDSMAPGAPIVLESERTVTLSNAYQCEAILPLNIDGAAVNVGAYIADFQSASSPRR